MGLKKHSLKPLCITTGILGFAAQSLMDRKNPHSQNLKIMVTNKLQWLDSHCPYFFLVWSNQGNPNNLFFFNVFWRFFFTVTFFFKGGTCMCWRETSAIRTSLNCYLKCWYLHAAVLQGWNGLTAPWCLQRVILYSFPRSRKVVIYSGNSIHASYSLHHGPMYLAREGPGGSPSLPVPCCLHRHVFSEGRIPQALGGICSNTSPAMR